MKRLTLLRLGLSLGIMFVFLFAISFKYSRQAFAQDHVVAPSDLQKDVASASAAREKNQTRLEEFVFAPETQHALKSAHLDAGQVKNAIPQLSDDDLAQLSAKAEKAQRDFSAGRMSDRDLIIVLIAIAALILINCCRTLVAA
jgi:hypothetical protein